MKITDGIGLLGGLALFLYGMQMMSSGMEAAAGNKMKKILEKLTANRFLGVAVGAGITAIIQSSSASVGILQVLAGSGIIPFSSAVYVLFGQNIGTCITAVLASIGTSRNAKRTTVIHLSFNIIGTIIFTIATFCFPLADLVASLTPGNSVAQIANMHTIFNVVTTALLLPFGTGLAKLSEKILPIRNESEKGLRTLYLNSKSQKGKIGSSAIYVEQVKLETKRMLEITKENVETSFQAFVNRDNSYLASVEEKEDTIDYLNKAISNYISQVIAHDRDEEGSHILSAYFKIIGNVERIGDHAMNICGYTQMLSEKGVVFSKEAEAEILLMKETSLEVMESLLHSGEEKIEDLTKIASLEQKIDDMTENYRNNMLRRMSQGTCSEEGCILYSEMLTDFERIGDHALNISQELMQVSFA